MTRLGKLEADAAEVSALRMLLREAWPYVAEHAHERTDAADLHNRIGAALPTPQQPWSKEAS